MQDVQGSPYLEPESLLELPELEPEEPEAEDVGAILFHSHKQREFQNLGIISCYKSQD